MKSKIAKSFDFCLGMIIAAEGSHGNHRGVHILALPAFSTEPKGTLM